LQLRDKGSVRADNVSSLFHKLEGILIVHIAEALEIGNNQGRTPADSCGTVQKPKMRGKFHMPGCCVGALPVDKHSAFGSLFVNKASSHVKVLRNIFRLIVIQQALIIGEARIKLIEA